MKHKGKSTLNIAMLSIHSSPVGPVGTEDTGGMSVYVREIARWLGHSGHHVDIFTCAGDGPPTSELYPNVRLVTLGQGLFTNTPKHRLPDQMPVLFEAVENFRRSQNLTYHIIYSHYWISGVVGAMAQAQWHCPHLLMFHTLGAVKNRTQSSENETVLRLGHEQWLVVAADHIVVPTQQEHNHLTSLYHAHSSKISIIPCGVNPALFHPMERQTARQSLGISPDVDLMLYVGRFAPLKGVSTIIKAAARMRTRYPRLKWFIVGGDDHRNANTQWLMKMFRYHTLDDVVEFKGRIEQSRLAAYYNAADALVLPSHYESFGLVVLESLACGTPVVASSVGAAADLVKEGLNGTLIKAPQTAALVKGVERIINTARDQRPTAEQIRGTVDSLNWKEVAAQIEQVLHTLIVSNDPRKKRVAYLPGGMLSN